MSKTSMLAASAVAAAAALPLIANAATPAPQPSYPFERCYGVNAVTKNDCGVRGVHSCAGESRVANDPQSWIYVPTGTCAKIQGGSLMPKV